MITGPVELSPRVYYGLIRSLERLSSLLHPLKRPLKDRLLDIGDIISLIVSLDELVSRGSIDKSRP
jgi:hypothetical protein